MELEFYKLQTCKNDFILINHMAGKKSFREQYAALALVLCPYHKGIGAKGVIILTPGREHAVRMDLLLADGTESRLINDAVICAGRYLFDSGMISKSSIVIETINGTVTIEIIDSRNFRISLGIPMTYNRKETLQELSETSYSRQVILKGKSFMVTPFFLQFTGVVVFVENPQRREYARVSRLLNTGGLFNESPVPVFTSVLSREELCFSVFTKKSPWDIASFSGIAAVGAIINGFIERDSVAVYDDDNLYINWNEKDNMVYVTAASDYVFTGSCYVEDAR
ncbi:MAG: hypothetical protein E4H36_00725 [Spirochaetales bacterium]|nr:MAG: hypothetical protein E4H36_00725 [Spirochaetales bacterium]